MNRTVAFLTTWRVPLLLAALCVGLGVALAAIIGAPVSPAAGTPEDAEAVAADATAERSFDLEPLASFEAIVERPLFSRSRRPPPVDRAATGDVRAKNTGVPFLLSGVVVAGATRVAFLQPRSQPKTLRVMEGETVEGWKVEKILPHQVVLGNGDVREELSLQDRNAPVPAAAKGRPEPPRDGRQPPRPPGREEMIPGQPFQPGDEEADGALENEPQ